MDAYDLILALVTKEPGSRIIGRTMLHKKLFFLNELLGGPIHFFPHYYGPYSREVASTVDSLVSAGLLVESTTSFPEYSTPWGESTRYTYKLPGAVTPNDVESILQKGLGRKDYKRVSQGLDTINNQKESKNYKALAIAAKVMQILKEKGRMHVGNFPKEAHRLGWKLSSKDVDSATSFLQELGLIRKEN